MILSVSSLLLFSIRNVFQASQERPHLHGGRSPIGPRRLQPTSISFCLVGSDQFQFQCSASAGFGNSCSFGCYKHPSAPFVPKGQLGLAFAHSASFRPHGNAGGGSKLSLFRPNTALRFVQGRCRWRRSEVFHFPNSGSLRRPCGRPGRPGQLAPIINLCRQR